MSDLQQFKQFALTGKENKHNKKGNGVIYTRVSTKEQAETNKSLETQKKYCERYAKKKNINIISYFGGTYESAKSDERKEFTKMLSFVKRNKSVSYIIVYSYDRFSRTGTNGAYISEQLKKQGIVTVSATQEVDFDSASGSFQQNLYYMFSQFDNELRKDKSVTGMKEKLESGHWVWQVPFGYTNLNKGNGKTPKIVVNEQGKLLRLAFKWRVSENITTEDVALRLKKKGLDIPSKRLGEYFKNPFYCGVMVSSLIPNRCIEGNHEKLVSKELFLKLNEILSGNNYGYKLNIDNENLPLKQFVKSSVCGTPYTGYIVRKKGLYYYKNNRKGSKENRSAKVMHQKFIELLKNYQLFDKKCIPVLQDMLKDIFVKQNKELLNEIDNQKKKVRELTQKLERLEERFVFEEITEEQYSKFRFKLEAEKKELASELKAKGSINLSNLNILLERATQYALNISNLWCSGTLETKRAIQNMLFPEGILFDFKNDTYRTARVNSIFSLISYLSIYFRDNEKRGNPSYLNSPALVGPAGLEPATT